MPQAEMYKRHWSRKKQSKMGKERRFSLPPRVTSAQLDEAGVVLGTQGFALDHCK